MKLIELLIKRAKLASEKMELSFSEAFLKANSVEQDKRGNKVFNDMVKRYNELNDQINEVYARVKVNVEEYGEISLATAISYFYDRTRSFGESDGFLPLLISGDYKEQMISSALFENNGCDNEGVNIFEARPCFNNKSGRERYNIVANWKKSTFLDLQKAIMIAVVETEV